MSSVDLVDETFVVAPPAAVAAAVHEPARWHGWWPDLALTVFMDRGEAGLRWNVTGALSGSAELWLEPYADGVVIHHYLRGELEGGAPDGSGRASHRGRRLARRHALRWKASVNALKDQLEVGRVVGEGPAAPNG